MSEEMCNNYLGLIKKQKEIQKVKQLQIEKYKQNAGKWIGRRGPTEWPSRSPDLTLPDFFLQGYLKSKVYDNRPLTIEDLTNNIIEECKKITPEMLRYFRNSWEMRLKHCIAVDGQQFEHLI